MFLQSYETYYARLNEIVFRNLKIDLVAFAKELTNFIIFKR